MIYLMDTNILIGFSYREDPRYQIVRPTVRELLSQGHQLQTTSQNLAEFWNVSTRPALIETVLGKRHLKQTIYYGA